MTNTEYVEHFKALVGMVETYGGAYGREPGLVAAELVSQGMKPEEVNTADRAVIIKAEEVCHKCYLPILPAQGGPVERHDKGNRQLSKDNCRDLVPAH